MIKILKRLLLFPGMAVIVPVEVTIWIFTGSGKDRLIGPFIDWVDS